MGLCLFLLSKISFQSILCKCLMGTSALRTDRWDKATWNSGKLFPLGGGLVYRWVSELRIILCAFDLTVKLSEGTQNPYPEVSSPEKPHTATVDLSASPGCGLLSRMLTQHSLQDWDLRQMWVRKNRFLQALVVFTGSIVSVETLWRLWSLSVTPEWSHSIEEARWLWDTHTRKKSQAPSLRNGSVLTLLHTNTENTDWSRVHVRNKISGHGKPCVFDQHFGQCERLLPSKASCYYWNQEGVCHTCHLPRSPQSHLVRGSSSF